MFESRLAIIEKDVQRVLRKKFPRFHKLLQSNSCFEYDDFIQDVYLELLKMGEVSSQNIIFAIMLVFRKYMRDVNKQKKVKKAVLKNCKEYFTNLCREYFASLDLYYTMYPMRNNEFARLYLEGYTLREIGAMYGVSYTAIRHRLIKFGFSIS